MTQIIYKKNGFNFSMRIIPILFWKTMMKFLSSYVTCKKKFFAEIPFGILTN